MVIAKNVGKEKGKKIKEALGTLLAYGVFPGAAVKLGEKAYKKLTKKTKAGPKGRPGSQIHKATSVKRFDTKKPKTQKVKRGQEHPKSRRV